MATVTDLERNILTFLAVLDYWFFLEFEGPNDVSLSTDLAYFLRGVC